MSQPARPIRVLIVDDHPLMREALAAALEDEVDLTVAAIAANGIEALQAYQEVRPDVVIMDLMMPLRDGLAATADILAFDPQARILVLTSALGDERTLQALTAGAQGYLLKDAERPQILEALRQVAGGELYLPPNSAGRLVRAMQHSLVPHAPESAPELSPRQWDVLALAAAGLNDTQIAHRLVLSETTVRVHLHNIIDKLGLPDRAAAIAWFERHRTGSSH
jgi:two-component system NarL family response regulator